MTKATLRYYDEEGLFHPDKRSDGIEDGEKALKGVGELEYGKGHI